MELVDVFTKIQVGDKLIALKRFPLTDFYQKLFYYTTGDEFIIMELNITEHFVRLQFNSVDSCFKFHVNQDDITDFFEYLSTEKDYKRKIRKMKLNKLLI